MGITLTEDEGRVLTAVIADDGRGMSPEFLAAVADPFTTTRTTRSVGMGIPLYRMAAELTGGSLSLASALGRGTTVTAVFHLEHLDCPPMGDLPGGGCAHGPGESRRGLHPDPHHPRRELYL